MTLISSWVPLLKQELKQKRMFVWTKRLWSQKRQIFGNQKMTMDTVNAATANPILTNKLIDKMKVSELWVELENKEYRKMVSRKC